MLACLKGGLFGTASPGLWFESGGVGDPGQVGRHRPRRGHPRSRAPVLQRARAHARTQPHTHIPLTSRDRYVR